MINKDKIKGYIAGLTTAILLCSTVAFAQSIEKTVTAVYNNIKIMIDGTQITPTDANGNVVEPFIIDGTTYLPVRAVATALNQDVNWDGNTNTVYIGKMPKTDYTINTETLKEFSDDILIKVGNKGIKGSFYNFYISQNANSATLSQICDNYSPEKTLQTLTINSVPVAKVFSDDISENFRPLLAIYNSAVKSGFASKSTVKKELDAAWNDYSASFTDKNDMAQYFESHATNENDVREFLNINTMYSLYINDMYEKNLAKSRTTKELKVYCDKNLVKAKHILVEDEEVANSIIEKIKSGESFDALVDEYNTDPGQGADGYTFAKGEMVPEFESAAFALKENTYTLTPAKTTYGYHIIYRFPIEESWIDENAQSIKNSIAYQETNDTILKTIDSAKITYTANYEKYITTIE